MRRQRRRCLVRQLCLASSRCGMRASGALRPVRHARRMRGLHVPDSGSESRGRNRGPSRDVQRAPGTTLHRRACEAHVRRRHAGGSLRAGCMRPRVSRYDRDRRFVCDRKRVRDRALYAASVRSVDLLCRHVRHRGSIADRRRVRARRRLHLGRGMRARSCVPCARQRWRHLLSRLAVQRRAWLRHADESRPVSTARRQRRGMPVRNMCPNRPALRRAHDLRTRRSLRRCLRSQRGLRADQLLRHDTRRLCGPTGCRDAVHRALHGRCVV